MATTPVHKRGLIFEPLINVQLFNQFTGVIIEIVSTTSIKLKGDATSLLSNNDVIIIPNYDFTVEYTINSISYVSNETTIVFDSGNFDSNYLGLGVALKIDITSKLSRRGVKTIESKIEGPTLADFDSGIARVQVDNTDFYFWDKDSTGLLQTSSIMWGKIFYKQKSDISKTLIFGGIVDLSDIKIDFLGRSCEFKIMGHSKEFDRYKAFLVNNPDTTDLLVLSGIDVVGFESSSNGLTREGIKTIKYKPFVTGPLSEIKVDSISKDYSPGLKIFEFRLPYFYRWDNGPWYDVNSIGDYTKSSGLVKMYGKGGSGDSKYAMVKFGDADVIALRPDFDTEMHALVQPSKESDSKLKVEKLGHSYISFDNGRDYLIRCHCQRVVKHINSSSTFVEISDFVNSLSSNDNITVLDADLDYVIFVSPEPFFGLKFLFNDNSGFTASNLKFYYSTGSMGFSVNPMGVTENLSDGTNGFQQDGEITWDEISDWRHNTLKYGTTFDEAYLGFMIKVVRVSATGTCTLQEVRLMNVALSENGDKLKYYAVQNLLTFTDSDESVIVEKKYDDTYEVHVPYNNVSINVLMKRALEQSNYITSKRNVDNIKYSGTARFNVWGKIPTNSYRKKPTALLVDSVNEKVYVALEDELWSCDYDGYWKKLTTVTNLRPAEKIVYLSFGSVGTTSIIIYTELRYDQFQNKTTQTHNSLYVYGVLTGNLTNSSSGASDNVWNGKWTWREGKLIDLGSGNYYRKYGNGNGENMTVPFTQLLISENADSNSGLISADDIDSVGITEFPYWYFDQLDDGIGDPSGPTIMTPMGYWFVDDRGISPNQDPVGIPVFYGAQGFLIDDNDNVYLFTKSTDANGDDVYIMKGAGTNNSLKWSKNRFYGYAPRMCGVLDSNDNIYAGFVQWHDDHGNIRSPAYITKYNDTKVSDWQKVFIYDASASSYSDKTTDVNNGTTVTSAVTGSGDIVYFSFNKRFRNFMFKQDHHNNNYKVEYWNGSAWTEVDDYPNKSLLDDQVCFRIPPDWSTTVVNGSSGLWVRVRCTSYSSNSNLEDGRLLEEVLYEFNQQLDWYYYMPLSLVLNPNEGTAGTIHGHIFNRERSTSSYPFRWAYFVLDLYDNEMVFDYSVDENYYFDGLVYNSNDDAVYSVTVNKRQGAVAVTKLIKATYSRSLPADGIITITEIGAPDNSEINISAGLAVDSVTGNVWGITGDKQYLLWEYGTSFYPRVETAVFSSDRTIKDVLSAIALRSNYYYDISPDRTISFIQRGTYRNDYIIDWSQNFIKSNFNIGYWRHKYDVVTVTYNNDLTDKKGEVKKGLLTWENRFLSISNELIQNFSSADLIASELDGYFGKYRLVIKRIRIMFLPEVRPLDRIKILIPEFIAQVSGAKYFVISAVKINVENRFVEVEGIEI